jgi:hypothetical protein
MKNPTLFSAALLALSVFVTSGAHANCDTARWTDINNDHNRGQYPPIEGMENTYLDLNPNELSGRINADGNIQFITIKLVNDQNGVCTINMVWEINCERQEFRLLRSTAFHDSDWPTQQDMIIEGDKTWDSYNTPTGVRRIGVTAAQFCARINQLQRMPP